MCLDGNLGSACGSGAGEIQPSSFLHLRKILCLRGVAWVVLVRKSTDASKAG